MKPLARHCCAMMCGCLLPLTVQAQQVDQYPLPPKTWPEPVADQPVISFLLVDRLEHQRLRGGGGRRVWDVQGWVGGDYNKFWYKTEGEKEVGGRTDEASVEALYARLISPYWFVQAGVRYVDRPSPSRTSLALGIQGLAVYQFNVEATAYLNEKGRFSARLEAEYEFLLTQRLILQPRFETGFTDSAEPERGVARGFDRVELGLRLRYEFRRQFGPYIGVSWSRRLGDTADIARSRGQDIKDIAVVAGLRVWF